MNNEDLDFIKKNFKWRFVWTDVFNSYLVLIGPLFIVFLSLMITYFSMTPYLDNGFLLITIPIFLFGGWFFYLILNRIKTEKKFLKMPFPYEFIKLNACFNQLNWTVLSQDENVVVAETKRSIFSCGQQITLIVTDKQMLFNSQPQNNQAFTFNMEKVHYRNLYNALMAKD